MTIEEFEKKLENVDTAVVKHGWGSPGHLNNETCKRSDGKYVLEAVARKLSVSYSNMSRWCLVDNIIRAERAKRLFTKREATGLSITMSREKPAFTPYTVSFSISTPEADDKFQDLLQRADDEFCGDADWLLEPLLQAVKGKGRQN